MPMEAHLALSHGEHPLAPWTAKIDLHEPITISRSSSIQIVVTDGDCIVGKAFLLKCDLRDMPMDHQTYIRQKHYYCNNTVTPAADCIHHGVQVCIRRVMESGVRESRLDSNGNLQLVEGRFKDRIQLCGSIRLVFTFNQAPTIGKDAVFLSSTLKERLYIVTEHPFAGVNAEDKYLPLSNPSISERDHHHRASRPYGQIL